MDNMKIAIAAYIFIHYALKRKRRKSRQWWQTNVYPARNVYSGAQLLSDLKFQSINGQYKNFTRMSPSEFEFLINLIGPKIAKKDTTFRKAISVQECLAITLRFLASGDSYTSLQYLFKVSKQSISNIVPEVCEAIAERLKDYIKIPKT